MIMTEKENTLIYAHHISYRNIRIFCRLFEPDYYSKFEKKNASKVPNNLLKSNCEFEGLGKFKMMLIVNMFKILSNHQSGSTKLENKTVSYL